MKIGHIWYNARPKDAEITALAVELFNRLGDSTPSDGGLSACEYLAEFKVVPDEEIPELVRVRLGFLAGNHIRKPMGWNECVASIRSAEYFIASRPAV